MPATRKILYDCQCCGREFQFGPHIYDGKPIARYKINVCNDCYRNNHDGWAPAYEDAVTARLRELGLPIPERNAAGFLPRD